MAYPLFHEQGAAQLPSLLTTADFTKAFPGEGTHVEFKQGIPEGKIGEAVAAFSNTDGGVVLLGVTNDGHVLGLEIGGETEAKIHRAVRNVRDAGRYAIHPLMVEQRRLLVLSVQRRRQGFAQLQDGRVLLRRGAMNAPAIGQELSRFVTERALTRFESTATAVRAHRADSVLVGRLADAFGWSQTDIGNRLIEAGLCTAAADDGGHLTVAGVLYLTRRPREAMGKAYIELFRHRDSSTYDRRVQLDGPIDQQIQEAVGALVSELGADVVVLGLRRHELPRIPEEVLREALANAVAHRSYELNAQAIRVDIWPDRVVIRSPGGLPEPVTLENIRDQNAPRNLDVIKILRRLRIAEDAGLGVDLMQDKMEAALLEPPKFETDETHLTITLALGSTVAPEERAWLAELDQRGSIRPQHRVILLHAARGRLLTNAAVRELIGVDSVQARQFLTRLRDLGFLNQEGERGGAVYSLARELSPPAGLQLSLQQLRDVVRSLAADGTRVTNEIVRERTGLDRARVLGLLSSMVEEGALTRHGERRGAYYTRSSDQRLQ